LWKKEWKFCVIEFVDPILKEPVLQVKESQEREERHSST
jgi:hypothetical protein